MLTLFDEWSKTQDKPYLMLGKGPSMSYMPDVRTQNYTTIGLNHVVEQVKVDIAHAIDIEVLHDCGQAIKENAEYLMMPWYPNKGFRPHEKTIHDLIQTNDILQFFYDRDKLLTYNRDMSSAPGREYEECVLGGNYIPTLFFSGDTVFNLLSINGEKKIYSLGVDW